jgi:hypothetical protein
MEWHKDGYGFEPMEPPEYHCLNCRKNLAVAEPADLCDSCYKQLEWENEQLRELLREALPYLEGNKVDLLDKLCSKIEKYLEA